MKIAAKICEFVSCVEFLSIEKAIGFTTGLPWNGLVGLQNLSFLGADCRSKVVAGIRKLVNTVLHVCLRGSNEDTIINRQKLVKSVC